MSIHSYHYSHHETEYWYNGKRNAHANDMSAAGYERLFGIEYETEYYNGYSLDLNAIADELQQAMGGRLKCESDGSLSGGFECISYPATFGCHMSSYGWHEFFRIVNEHTPTVHGARMHVHVSRAALGQTDEARDLCIAKLVYILDNCNRTISKLAGRNYTNHHYCAANGADIQKTDRSAVAVYKAKRTNDTRYRALNLTNANTIEFRIFAVDYSERNFRARIQLVNWLIDYCKSHTFTDVYNLTTAKIKKAIEDLPADKYGELQELYTETCTRA